MSVIYNSSCLSYTLWLGHGQQQGNHYILRSTYRDEHTIFNNNSNVQDKEGDFNLEEWARENFVNQNNSLTDQSNDNTAQNINNDGDLRGIVVIGCKAGERMKKMTT